MTMRVGSFLNTNHYKNSPTYTTVFDGRYYTMYNNTNSKKFLDYNNYKPSPNNTADLPIPETNSKVHNPGKEKPRIKLNVEMSYDKLPVEIRTFIEEKIPSFKVSGAKYYLRSDSNEKLTLFYNSEHKSGALQLHNLYHSLKMPRGHLAVVPVGKTREMITLSERRQSKDRVNLGNVKTAEKETPTLLTPNELAVVPGEGLRTISRERVDTRKLSANKEKLITRKSEAITKQKYRLVSSSYHRKHVLSQMHSSSFRKSTQIVINSLSNIFASD